jgi:repressor LexA
MPPVAPNPRNPRRRSTAATARQQRVLDFVRRYTAAHRYPPSLADIGNGLGIRSTNGVAGHLRALRTKGLIDGPSHEPGPAGRRKVRARAIRIPGLSGGFLLPMLGVVAAGSLLEAEPEADQLDLKTLFGGDGLSAYRIEGGHLESANVSDGDFVVIEKTSDPPTGRTVVVEASGVASLSLFLKQAGGGVKMVTTHGPEPAPGPVRVLGLFSGVIRRT